MSVCRVFITGGPASGKTTLAQHLAAALGVPAYELDGLLLAGEARGEPFEVISRDALSSILAENAWVVEGAYLGWTEPLLRRADLIVSMDVPWRVASYRIITRHIRATVARNNRFPGWRRLYQFWRWSGAYYNSQDAPALHWSGVPDTKATAIRYLAPYEDKLVTCRTLRDAEMLLMGKRDNHG